MPNVIGIPSDPPGNRSRMASLHRFSHGYGRIPSTPQLRSDLLLADAVGGQTGIVRLGNKIVRSKDRSTMPFTEFFVPPSR